MLELVLSPKRVADEKALPHVRHYDAWITAGGDGLTALAYRISEMLRSPTITQERKPRADAMERRKRSVETLVANLLIVTLDPAEYVGLAVPLRNAGGTRYDRRAFTVDVLRQSIKDAENAGLVSVEKGKFKERRTVVVPTPRFRQLVAEYAVSIVDIHHLAGRETIELWTGSNRGRDKMPVHYEDCPEADALRAQMAEINRVLNDADIRLDGEPTSPIHLVRQFHTDQPGDAIKFDRHGRIYGGFWEDLPRKKRGFLTIDGEPVADLDFSSMFVQLAYFHQGAEPLPGDQYEIPGLEGYRSAVKSPMVSLFFRKVEAQRLPAGSREELPEGWNMTRFKAAVKIRHPAIAHLFDTNVGFELMARESEILVGILLELASKGVAALPMHDGIMVAACHKNLAIETMRKVSAERVGRPLKVVVKAI
ncbi:DNA-binding MarR family transcriptional regulator [Rhizobium sp. BK077]|uniref:hypothetical protein n=1 Tax=unclassified Rhizobium TaxID=2613769 RepID=UPI001613E273|nr:MULTISPECIES: hypothetical protein [unclassified Rhizobium]MBB3303084.1 DNA-binding MarR family transcriptional regulator [Rhizobium sp. BK112]MBB3371977.1 DNA-binding MarR family transcriptional regulator [Rhizobium sp. BK077]MBB4182943.1 DNA-binding MarR family transcriptional regulator [Rhizobium sp. BK109]